MKRLIGGCICTMVLLASDVPAFGGGTIIATELVASGMQFPVYATHAPGDSTRLFILEKPGRIRILNIKSGVLQVTPFLDINSLVGGGSSTNDEHGLLGLAFHPEYQTNGLFYVNYTKNTDAQGQEDTVIARYQRLTPDLASPASAFTVLTFDQPQGNHNGGWIDFGPNDGYLYIGTGDGGGSCDNGSGHTTGTGNSQDITDNLLGKLLRIDVDGASPYAIPTGNPFVDATGDDEIWSYGLRNPWRCAFDRGDADGNAKGNLYIGDVGQNAFEEIDYQRATSNGRENYGWRCMEGNSCSSVSGCPTTGCTCNSPQLTYPIQTYGHSCSNGGFSLTGGYVYRGCAVPDLQGTYFYADYVCGNFWSLRYDGSNVTEFQSRNAELTPSIGGQTVNQVSSFGEDYRGELYIVDQGSGSTGQVFRVRADAYSVPFTDINCDLTVNILDLLDLLAAWGPCDGCPADVTGDGVVGILDLLALLADWGPVI